jgi:hypothetical protein
MSLDQAVKEPDAEAKPDVADQPDPAGGESGKAPGSADASAEKGAEKGAEKPAAKSGNLFDGLDDEDGEGDAKAAGQDGADKGNAKDKKADQPGDEKAPDAKAEETDEQKRERLAADAAWRDRVAEKLLAPLKDKLSAKKFEQRREQIINQLKRSKSIDDAIVSGILAQEKLRAGEHKRPPEDASAEEQAAWRKENDVPEAPEKYDIPAIPGHTWTEKDQPAIDAFRQAAHSENLTQRQVNALVDWHVKDQQRIADEMDAQLKRADIQDREECYDQIRTEFGVREFKPHMAAMKRLIEDDEVFGEGNAERIMSARFFDEDSGTWRRLTSIPGVARGLIGIALDRYGDVPMPSGDGSQKAGKTRLEEIQAIMNSDMDRYFREGLADEAMKIQQDIERKAARRSGRGAR